ncbi:MAG: hypothetical protein ABIC91_00180 [Nanoarchaeota archaeon]
MKSTLDTNVFLYSTITKSCSDLIKVHYHFSKYNIILKSVSKETRPKLLDLFSFFQVFLSEIGKTKKSLVKLLDSDFYAYRRKKYPQIFDVLKNHIIKNKLEAKDKIKHFERDIQIIINDINFLIKLLSSQKISFPTTTSDFNKILVSKQYINCWNKLNNNIKIKKSDQQHLCLCNQYLKVNMKNKDQLSFITLDEKDFIKNKNLIEKIVSGLIIKEVEGCDIRNIKDPKLSI